MSDGHTFVLIALIGGALAIAAGIGYMIYAARRASWPHPKHLAISVAIALSLFGIAAAVAWHVDPPHEIVQATRCHA